MSTVLSAARRESLNKYGRLEIVGRTVTWHERRIPAGGGGRGGAARTSKPKSRDEKMLARGIATSPGEKRKQRRQKLLLLQEEKDRFDAMREIQDNTRQWKQCVFLVAMDALKRDLANNTTRFLSLGMAFLAFGILWCMGALVFMIAEQRLQNMTYFESLYFCFVALLTIGFVSPMQIAGTAPQFLACLSSSCSPFSVTPPPPPPPDSNSSYLPSRTS